MATFNPLTQALEAGLVGVFDLCVQRVEPVVVLYMTLALVLLETILTYPADTQMGD